MTKRLKIRFPSEDALRAAQAMEMPHTEPAVTNAKRGYIAVEVPDVPDTTHGAEAVRAGVERAPALGAVADQFGAEIVEDYQYHLEDEPDAFTFEATAEASEASLPDVTAAVQASAAWKHATGEGVTIAIVDTGVDGSHPEFAGGKQVGSWEPPGDTPWTDWEGHGTMCATIAAASDQATGSRYRGIAPEAGLIACKTRFFDSELAAIYDFLTARRTETGEPLVASNSFGLRVGSPPPPPAASDFIPALDDAVAAGILVVFSAGNNHQLAGGAPTACHPNSIWLHKSRADLMAVATCELNKAMWFYSSRGPGQHFGEPNTRRKPDVTAPTPRNGKILYGPGERVLPNGWGTSGACPQVAGLAALILALEPSETRATVFDAIRDTATPIGHGHDCEGDGMIDCGAAVQRFVAKMMA